MQSELYTQQLLSLPKGYILHSFNVLGSSTFSLMSYSIHNPNEYLVNTLKALLGYLNLKIPITQTVYILRRREYARDNVEVVLFPYVLMFNIIMCQVHNVLQIWR